ncbi:DUF3828 domain-containing protein [Undibacterium flavidum]|uniref:DUF3828 domain-containing protein n=1 Tax=Undibacterium flavidum TaxID=2762297 RepID=A0ABR6YFW3_9BURK|nr:DUF3828 domain-containing protein [Undibacterium flavidum]MBC3875423.1 DUF3828 domain-containing protein [Undibacterium flavidum]
MSYIFRFFLMLIALTLPALINASERSSAHDTNVPALKKMVEASYKEYAWIVVFGVDSTSKSLISLNQESLVKLRRIFTDELALAIFNDAQCARKTKEVCALDFDILFDSQDPDARDLTIRSKTKQLVEVCFIEQTTKRRCLEFVGVSGNGKKGEQIYDIKYDQTGRTLRKILKLK